MRGILLLLLLLLRIFRILIVLQTRSNGTFRAGDAIVPRGLVLGLRGSAGRGNGERLDLTATGVWHCLLLYFVL